MSFHVGQKVVCVDSTSGEGDWFGDGPVEGSVYTVRRVFVDIYGVLVFWLDEIRRCELSVAENGPNIGYGAFRFRPVRETSIECLRVHLAPIKQREEA